MQTNYMDIFTLISWSLCHGQNDATVHFRGFKIVNLAYMSSEARHFAFTVLIENVIRIYPIN